jgi:hypothetical protein
LTGAQNITFCGKKYRCRKYDIMGIPFDNNNQTRTKEGLPNRSFIDVRIFFSDIALPDFFFFRHNKTRSTITESSPLFKDLAGTENGFVPEH